MSARRGSWEQLERPAPEAIDVGGVEVRRGSRVRLHPRATADVWDLALDGREAIVEGIEQDVDHGGVLLTVVIADDPGRDLGLRRQPGHRFFFAPAEVEPLAGAGPEGAGACRILVAGIGNVFLGDDGFGVALADRLAQSALPAGVEVVDYGIRGMDLAYALLEGWDAVVLLDATPCGKAPGTLYVIEPALDLVEPAFDAHGMDPVTVLALARALGGELPRTLVVGCEPQTRMTGDEPEVVAGLSEPVRAALDAAVPLVEEVLGELITEDRPEGGRPT
jgi:hydrogenase maturation protease